MAKRCIGILSALKTYKLLKRLLASTVKENTERNPKKGNALFVLMAIKNGYPDLSVASIDLKISVVILWIIFTSSLFFPNRNW